MSRHITNQLLNSGRNDLLLIGAKVTVPIKGIHPLGHFTISLLLQVYNSQQNVAFFDQMYQKPFVTQ